MKKKVMLRLLAIIEPHTVPAVRHCNKKTLQAVLFHAAMHQSFQRGFAENCDPEPETKGVREMPKFNHAYDFAFEVISDRDDAEDVTAPMLRAALLERVNRLTDEELLLEAGRFDTYEEE